MTIILTNPDVVLYRGEDPARIRKELEDYCLLKDAGLLPGRHLDLRTAEQKPNKENTNVTRNHQS